MDFDPWGKESTHRLTELLTQLRTWLDLPDPGPTIASCAAAASVPLDGEEAAWLLNVAAPSAGKTEAVNLLDHVTNGRLNEITPPDCWVGLGGRIPTASDF